MKNQSAPFRLWTGLAILLTVCMVAMGQQYIDKLLKIGGGYGDTGVDIETDGDIFTDGDVTANSFIGDGSSLTGVGAADTSDNVFRIQDNGDPTKEIAFEASAISAGTTRTISVPNTNVDLGAIATNSAKVSNATHTGDVTGSTALTIASGAIDAPGMFSATGTPDGTTFLRGDNTWATPSGGGDVTGPGVSVANNAIARFDGTDGTTIVDSGITIDDDDDMEGVTSINGNIAPSGSSTLAVLADLTDFITAASTNTLTNKRITRRTSALTDASTVAINSDNFDLGIVTLTDNRTLGADSGTPTQGQLMEIWAYQDGGGGNTLAYSSSTKGYAFSDDIPEPTLSTAGGALDKLLFEYNTTAQRWQLVAVVKGF